MANGSTLPDFVPTQNTGYMCIRELPYADDSALVANNAVDICMQQIVDRSSSAADMLGLKIIISKTELLYQPPPMSIELPETITVHGEPLKTTEPVFHLPAWAAPSQTSTLQVWKWKGGSNPPRRPMVRYRRDSGAS